MGYAFDENECSAIIIQFRDKKYFVKNMESKQVLQLEPV